MNAHAESNTQEALHALIKRELRSIQPDKLPLDWDDTASFKDDLGLDSLDLVEMIARVEQVLNLFVPDADVPKLHSVSAAAEYLHGLQLLAAPPAVQVPAPEPGVLERVE